MYHFCSIISALHSRIILKIAQSFIFLLNLIFNLPHNFIVLLN